MARIIHRLAERVSRYLGKEFAIDADTYFNRKIPPDVLGVLDAASQLDATEFDVFRGAYREWFGREPADPEIEPYFAHYMYSETAPHWVRSYTRRVRETAARRTIDPREFGIQPAPVPDSEVRRGRIYIAVVGVFLLVIFLAITRDDALLAVMRNCILPPCY